jgi:hypothetical protein
MFLASITIRWTCQPSQSSFPRTSNAVLEVLTLLLPQWMVRVVFCLPKGYCVHIHRLECTVRCCRLSHSWDSCHTHWKWTQLKCTLYLIAINVNATVFHENLTVGQNSTSQLSRLLFEKLIAPQRVKEFPELFGTRRFITVFARCRLPSIFWFR